MEQLDVSKIKTLSGHKDCIYTIERYKDPAVFFSGAGDGMVAQWDLREENKGRLIAKLDTSVYALNYHESNNSLIVGQNYEGIHVIDVETKKELGSLKLTEAALFDIKSHEDLVFIGTGKGEVIIVHLPDLRILKKIKPSFKSARCISINPSREEFAIGYSDHSIRIFDLQSFAHKQTISGHTNSVFTVQYSPDYNFLLSAGRDAHLKVWAVDENYRLQRDIVAHMYAINHIAYSPNGRYFCTCSMDKSIKVWDAEKFKLLKVIDKARHAGHGTSVNKLLWTSYNEFLISGSDDRSIAIWNVKKMSDKEGII